MIGRIFASLSGLFVTLFGSWGLWQFVERVRDVLAQNPTLTFADLMTKQGGNVELALVVSLILLGLNLFIPNCVLLRKVCGTSCDTSECTSKKEKIEVVKA